MLIFSIVTQSGWWKRRCFTFCGKNEFAVNHCQASKLQGCKNDQSNCSVNGNPNSISTEENFLSEQDMAVLNRMSEFQNNPISLLCVGLPAYTTLAMCPIVIYVYITWGHFFWPSQTGHRMPDINEAIANFLVPAGLVYAIAFGFAYQDVLSKNSDVEKRFDDQRSLLYQTWELIKCSSSIPKRDKHLLAAAIKSSVVTWMANLLSMKEIQIKGMYKRES